MLYWDLGRQITEKQEATQWGSGFMAQLSKDLREEFPEMTGFSQTNLFRMRKFYQFYSPVMQHLEIFPQAGGELENGSREFVPQLAKQMQPPDFQEIAILPQLGGKLEMSKILLIPWRHNICIIEKISDLSQALFYINKTIENNWSRAVLEYQIETNLYGRQGKAVTNFNLTLPAPQSDLANAIMKDPYFEENNYAVEFSLKDVRNPIGVSTFHYTELSDDIKAALPSEKALQNELLTFERKHGERQEKTVK
jgi:predicted nuclease of restriction endonuclease-like (RecB) superfamily